MADQPDATRVLVGHLSWSGDSRHLAYQMDHVADAGDLRSGRTEVRVLDTSRAGTLLDGRLLAPERDGARWSTPALRGRFGTVAVVESCGDAGPASPAKVVSVNLDTGEVLATHLDFDASGRHLLYVATTEKVDGVNAQRDELYRWSGGEPVKLGDYAAAAW